MSAHSFQTVGRFLVAVLLSALVHRALAAAPASPQGVITAKGFLDIPGTSLSDLANNAKFPDKPDVIYYPAWFEWNVAEDIHTIPNNAYGDLYGTQILGYFYPPATGDYVFWISSDDNGALYLSTDDDPANRKLIAQEIGFSNPRNWESVGSGTLEAKNSQTFTGTEWPTKDPTMGGAKITLIQGRAYYLEALSKEGTGGDNLAVAVRDPNDAIDSSLPIPGEYLATFDKTAGPAMIATQPRSQEVDEGHPVTFEVVADGTPPYTYQWRKDRVNITDATNPSYTIPRVSRTENGARFSVVVTGAAGPLATSADAVLTVVNLDETPPRVVLASTSIGTTVKIEYDEWVEPASAINKANYAIANVTITDATLSDDSMTVTLAITGNLPANFEVTLGGIKDFAGNAIPADTKVPGYTTGLSPNMVAYWPLDTIEGTKTPDVVSGYDLNLENMTADHLVNGKFGKCFLFDNERQALLRRTHNPGDQLPIYNHIAFTVSVWVSGPIQTDHRVYCESRSTATQPMFSIGTHQTGVASGLGSVDTYIRNDSNTTSGGHHFHGIAFDETWHHICYVQNSNASPRAILYIDGVQDAVLPAPVWPMTIDTTCIGAVQRAASVAWFTGMIDDVAVWSRALDPDEVNFLYSNGTPQPPPKVLPLVISSFVSELPAAAVGDSVTLHWDVSKDATSVSIEPDIGDVTARTEVGVGNITVTANTTTTYEMTVKRGNETVTSELQVAAIAGVAPGWTLLDNFDRYAVGVLSRPWGVSGAGVTVVNVNGNRMMSVSGGGDSLAGLVLNNLAVKEGSQRTLFARFYLPAAVAAGGINQYMGLSDKGIRFFGDSDGDLGPDVAFQNPSGSLIIGTWNGFGSGLEFASFSLQPQTVYNLWIDIRNDPIADGDLFSIYLAADGDANRILLFQEYRSDRNPTPDPGDLVGYPTKPDLTVLHVAGNTTTSSVDFDDFYLSKSGYLSTVPRVYGFSTPVVLSDCAGLEADVAPRGNVNGVVTVSDWVQVGRFVAGLDQIGDPCEFQRADGAPRLTGEVLTGGNGQITVSDWVQAGRYAAGLDPVTSAVGPTEPLPLNQSLVNRDNSSIRKLQASDARVVRLASKAGLQTGSWTAILSLDSAGGENALGCSVAYDPVALRYRHANLGGQFGQATLLINSNQASAGRLGLALALPIGEELIPGPWTVLEIEFELLAQNPAGGGPAMNFACGPVYPEIVDARANTLRATWEDGSTLDRGTDDLPNTPPVVWQTSGLTVSTSAGVLTISWPAGLVGGVLEASSSVGPGAVWIPVIKQPLEGGGTNSVRIESADTTRFYRLRR
jgi:hypothetical protein